MARSAIASLEEDEDDSNVGLSTPRNRGRPSSSLDPSLSPPPSVSVSSDKENRSISRPVRNEKGKGKARAIMATSPTPPLLSSRSGNATSVKRRRVTDREGTPQAVPSDHGGDGEEGEAIDQGFYDPDQDREERRAVRKALRDLTRDLNDSRSEYLAPQSTGLVDTLNKANEYFHSVKQTSDATIDSRLLVSTADLSYKKTTLMMLGDASQGVDVDEFVSKCVTFMRLGPTDHQPNATPRGGTQTQRRRRQRRRSDVGSDDENADDGDTLNWAHLGRRACYPHNTRPAVPSFLLGPLSVQKRARAQNTARRAQQRRTNPAELVRPEELQATDIEKQENSNLTILCTRIRKVLVASQEAGQDALATEAEGMEKKLGRELDDEELQTLFDKHGVYEDGGVGFFRFVVHPRSFGQTVENLFYVSFLIRDGSVGISEDRNGLPTLHPASPSTAAQIKDKHIKKHQAVFNLDYKTWLDLIDVFGVKEPIIPDRSEAEQMSRAEVVGARGWYG